MSITVTVARDGPPNRKGTNWTATIAPGGRTFLVRQSASYSPGSVTTRGIYQSKVIAQLPQLAYDRAAAAARHALWAHFIWPSVIAESNGYHLTLNTYDRAAFTFGFYQLAAHKPKDNLILLFRHLLTLPSAANYLPDLVLQNGKVHPKVGGVTRNLEAETSVTLPSAEVETQIVGFMTYLNPDSGNVGDIEVINGAKLMDWLLRDRAAMQASEDIAFEIMKRKLAKRATQYGLRGKDPRLAIWVSDIHHQGRGRVDDVKTALRATTLAGQLDALSKVDTTGTHAPRRSTVKRCIAQLHSEGIFAGVTLGDANLPI
jgi:hypothetical protein